jgi:hypothetical protein
LLASLKEFVKTWGTGGEGSFQLDRKDGQCKMSMELNVGALGSSPFTPAEDNQDTLNRDKRRKNPFTLRRDKKRAEQNLALMASPRPDPAARQVQHAVEEHKHADQHGDFSPHPSDPAAGTKTFGMPVLSCQDGIHLGWRRRPWLDGGLGGSSWNVDQVKELRARLWTFTYFKECIGREVTSLQAEKRRTEEICMATGLSVRYKTLGPDSWDPILA